MLYLIELQYAIQQNTKWKLRAIGCDTVPHISSCLSEVKSTQKLTVKIYIQIAYNSKMFNHLKPNHPYPSWYQ